MKIEITPEDYAPFYAGYVDLVMPASVNEILNSDVSRMESLFGKLDEDLANSRYAEGKWTVKEVIQHLIDTERIFTYRALMIARGETNNLRGFDHNAFVETSHAASRSIKSLTREWQILRSSTQALFQSFSESDFQKVGMASDAKITVGALVYLTVGHSLHHLGVLQDKYGIDF